MGKNPQAVLTSSPAASEAQTQNKSSGCGAGGDPRLWGSVGLGFLSATAPEAPRISQVQQSGLRDKLIQVLPILL